MSNQFEQVARQFLLLVVAGILSTACNVYIVPVQTTPVPQVVTVVIPVSPTPPRSSVSSPAVFQAQVLADKGWQDTGISIATGQQVTIEYVSGLWFQDPPGTWHDASGGPNPFTCAAPECHEPSHDFPKYALIGKIGNASTILMVGNHLDLVADTNGVLYLRPNYGDVDMPIHNPQGSVSVKVTIR